MDDLTDDEVNALRAENGLPPKKPDRMPDWAKAKRPSVPDPDIRAWCERFLKSFKRGA